MTLTGLDTFRTLSAKLGTKVVTQEWEYFQEWARRFDLNEPEKRYGILIMDQAPKEENMIYSPDIGELRLKHLERLTVFGTGSAGERQRKFLNWLEKMEGKS